MLRRDDENVRPAAGNFRRKGLEECGPPAAPRPVVVQPVEPRVVVALTGVHEGRREGPVVAVPGAGAAVNT